MKYLFTFLICALILIAVLIPGANLPEVDFTGLDKIVHIGLFGLWALAVYYDFNLKGYKYVIAFLTGLSFSVFTEILQIFVEGRTFDWTDIIADAIGLFLGLVLAGTILRLIKKIFNIDSSKPS